MSVVIALITNNKVYCRIKKRRKKADLHDARQIIFGNSIPKEKRASKTNTATKFLSFRLNNNNNNKNGKVRNRNEGDENHLLALLSLIILFNLRAENQCIVQHDDAVSDEFDTQFRRSSEQES